MKNKKDSLITSNFFALLSLSIVIIVKDNQLAAFCLLLIAVALLVIKGFKGNVLIYLYCGIFGALTESMAVYFNIWQYSQPDILGIPYWLPFIWGIAGIYISTIYNKIINIK